MARISVSATRLRKKNNIKREWLEMSISTPNPIPVAKLNAHNPQSIINNIIKNNSISDGNKFSKILPLTTLASGNERNSKWSLAQNLAFAFGFGLIVAECKKHVKTGNSQ